jgi:hypothetical protein
MWAHHLPVTLDRSLCQSALNVARRNTAIGKAVTLTMLPRPIYDGRRGEVIDDVGAQVKCAAAQQKQEHRFANNEDAELVSPRRNLCVVAEGLHDARQLDIRQGRYLSLVDHLLELAERDPLVLQVSGAGQLQQHSDAGRENAPGGSWVTADLEVCC